MIKFKNIFICIALQLVVFSLLFLLVIICASKYGSVENRNYILALEMISYISVVIGGFFGSRIAWDRGGVYAIIMSLFWALLRISFNFIFEMELDFRNIIIKSIIIILVGFCAGIMGVAKKNTNFV